MKMKAWNSDDATAVIRKYVSVATVPPRSGALRSELAMSEHTPIGE